MTPRGTNISDLHTLTRVRAVLSKIRLISDEKFIAAARTRGTFGQFIG